MKAALIPAAILFFFACSPSPSTSDSGTDESTAETVVDGSLTEQAEQDSSMASDASVSEDTDTMNNSDNEAASESASAAASGPEGPSTQKPDVEFKAEGKFALQVESWRNELIAQKRADHWRTKGYTNSNVVQYGNEETGDIWFRVQIGRVDDFDTASELRRWLMEEEQQPSWIVEID